jgi:uncharacterized membrane protein YphA (DoxX/SURF4 family)
LTVAALIAQPACVNFLGKYSGWAYAALRIIVGLLFATHGAQKAFGMFGARSRPRAIWFLPAGPSL